jgi:hypothetical protein
MVSLLADFSLVSINKFDDFDPILFQNSALLLNKSMSSFARRFPG